MKSAFLVPSALIMIFELINGSFTFFLPIHLSAIGLSGLQIGVLFALTIVSSLLVQFFIGILTDKVPIKLVIAGGFIVLAGYLFGFAVSTTFAAMLIVFLLRGFSEPTLKMPLDAFVLKKAEGTERIGRYKLAEHSALGIGIVASGFLIFSLDFPLAMQIAAAAALLSVVLALRLQSVKGSVEGIHVYFNDIKKPNVLFFALFVFLFSSHWGVEQTSYGLFLKENLGLAPQQIGIFIGIPILFLGLGSLFFGKLRDRGMTFRKLLVAGLLLSGGSFAGMALSQHVPLAFLFRIVHEFGDGAWAIFALGGAYALFKTERMGGNYGFIALSGLLGGAVGTLVYGPIGDAFGYHVPHIISGCLTVLLTLLVPFLDMDGKRAEPRAAAFDLVSQETSDIAGMLINDRATARTENP